MSGCASMGCLEASLLFSTAGGFLPQPVLAAASREGALASGKGILSSLLALKFERPNNFRKISCSSWLISILLLIPFTGKLTLAAVPSLALNPPSKARESEANAASPA